jgi:hypothetical protein
VEGSSESMASIASSSKIDDGLDKELAVIGLVRFAAALRREGWDSTKDLRQLPQSVLSQVGKAAGMPAGYAWRFSQHFAHEAQPPHRSNSIDPPKGKPQSKLGGGKPSREQQQGKPPHPIAKAHQSKAKASTSGGGKAPPPKYSRAQPRAKSPSHTNIQRLWSWSTQQGATHSRKPKAPIRAPASTKTPARAPNTSSVVPPRHSAAAASSCTRRVGDAPPASAFRFVPADCVTSATAFSALVAGIGPWPTAWQEGQPDAIFAYNALQSLPLPVGGRATGCARVLLEERPIEAWLSPLLWDPRVCFWFASLQEEVAASEGARACTRDCHVCSIGDNGGGRAYFHCDQGQPQAWLSQNESRRGLTPPAPVPVQQSAPLPSRAGRKLASQPDECSRPRDTQLVVRPPSLSPVLPLPPGVSPRFQPQRPRNWCGNLSSFGVSGVGSWSVIGRRRYSAWPQLSGAPFLSGSALRSHADVVLFDFDSVDVPRSATELSRITDAGRRPIAVYVRGGHAVGRFLRDHHRRLPTPYVLITGGTDACGPAADVEAVLDSPKLLAWFARNPSTVHPKLQPLPTGVDTSNTSLYARALALAPLVPKDRLLYASFTRRQDASSKDRREALAAAERLRDSGAFWHAGPPRLAEITDAFNVMRAKFVLSPVGNGADCTRTYRALLLGSIPVVNQMSNPLVKSGLYNGLPVLVVDGWQQLSLSFLTQRHKELSARFQGGWERRTLFAEAWVERIRATLETGRIPTGVCDGESFN